MLTEHFWVLRLLQLLIFLAPQWTTVSVVKQLTSDITQCFAGHVLMSGANIQVWERHLNVKANQHVINSQEANRYLTPVH